MRGEAEQAMIVVGQIMSNVLLKTLEGKERDTLVLTSEERRWSRKRVRTLHGREIALALPTGTILSAGDVLVVEPDWYLQIEAAREPVMAVFPRDHTEALRVAFEVGNRHFPLALDDEKTLLVPDDPAMAQLLDRINVPWERRHAVFFPIGHAAPH